MYELDFKEQSNYRFYPEMAMADCLDTGSLSLGSFELPFKNALISLSKNQKTLNEMDLLSFRIINKEHPSKIIVNSKYRKNKVFPSSVSFDDFQSLLNKLKDLDMSSILVFSVKTKEEKETLKAFVRENIVIQINDSIPYLITTCFITSSIVGLSKSTPLKISFNSVLDNYIPIHSLELLKDVCYLFNISEIDLTNCSVSDAVEVASVFDWHIENENAFVVPKIKSNKKEVVDVFESIIQMYKLACKI